MTECTQLRHETTDIYLMPLTEAADAAEAIVGVGSHHRRLELGAEQVLLADILGPDATIGHDADGAPRVEGHPSLHISISHSRDMLALAIDPHRPIGIDIETPRPNLRRVAPRFLTPDELGRTRSLHDLLRAWTAKEALFKVAGHRGVTLIDMPLPRVDGTVNVDSRDYTVTAVIDNEDTVVTLAAAILS